MNRKKYLTLAISGLILGNLQGAILFEDNFTYANGALSQTSPWTRAPNADNPSNIPTVSDNKVSFVVPTTARVQSIANRDRGSGNEVSSGWIYVAFDFQVTVAPSGTADSAMRPGFLALRNSDGSANRGRIGITPGSKQTPSA
ncbi:MAG: hypothetical protein LR015_08840 [Verrucomicrobia bacterium]|nr:hypothetical protein [Verrucomicrobiota bacterium]